MAIGKELFDLLYSLRNKIKGKNVVSLGNPYISNININKYFKVDLSEIKNIPINEFSKYLFEKYFQVKSFKIIDITDQEKADFIHNLNFEITQKHLLNQFDLVIDPGTSEHIFNQSQIYQIFLNFLKMMECIFFLTF